MLGRMRAMAFVPVADLERAATFYESVLGLDLVSSVPGVVCVFDAGGTALRVTAVADHVAAGWTVVGWAVPDLDSALRHLGESGVEPNSYPGMTGDDGTWTAPGGDRIAWLTDPDGNVLSLTQFVADHAQAREIAPIFPTGISPRRSNGTPGSGSRPARSTSTAPRSTDSSNATASTSTWPRSTNSTPRAHERGVPLRRRRRCAVRRVGGGGSRGALPSRGRHRLRTARGRLRRSRRQPRPLRLLRLT